MKPVACLCFLLLLSLSCKKNSHPADEQACDMTAITAQNSSKVTISNGVWGTVSVKQGNCMPMVTDGSTRYKSTCSQCPISREVRVYAYTTIQNAVATTGGYSSFNSQLIATVHADVSGFYQLNLPDGKYTVVMVNDGLLYCNSIDGSGGLNPVIISSNKVKSDLVLDHAAY